MEINARIYKARKDAGLTQDELAEAVGKTRGAVAQWEAGTVRPRHSTLLAIATATKTDILWIESGIGDEPLGLKVIGEIAAGIWKENSLEYVPYSMPVLPDPNYSASAQRLYKVSGNSLNKTVNDGAYIHCVNIHDGDIIPEHGDLVVVRRSAHGKTEYTAKRLILDGGEKILRPESNDARWQEDIVLDGDDDTEIIITDVVIAKWSPLRRPR